MTQTGNPEASEAEVYWWRPLDEHHAPDTRSKILIAAYKEIHLNGFQSASLSNILAHTGVTKGALYHHFPNKTELGYAVVDEIIAATILRSFIAPLEDAEDQIGTLIEVIRQSGCAFSLRDVELGCPLSSLAQEMAPIDEGFRQRLSKIYDNWHDAIARAVTRAQQKGDILSSVNAEDVAVMVVATMEGCLSAGKISQDLHKLERCGAGLVQYLKLIQQKGDEDKTEANDG